MRQQQILWTIVGRFSSKIINSIKSPYLPSTSVMSVPLLKLPEMSSLGKLIMIDMASAGFNPEFSDNCSQIFDGICEIKEKLDRFDYDANCKANGYRSLLKIILIYSDVVFKEMNSNSFSSVSLPLQQMAKVFALLIKHIKLNHVMDRDSLVWPYSFEFIKLGLSLEPSVIPFYGKLHNFWLCPSLRPILGHYITLTACRSMSAFGFMKLANHPRVFANFAMNASVEFAASMWNLSEVFIYRKLLSLLIYGTKSGKGRTYHIPRQSILKLNESGELLNDSDGNFSPNHGQVRIRMLQEQKGIPDSQSVVLHIHGAGFIAQSPDSHEIYLRNWSYKLDQVPIISVDYRLSPKYTFPAALQDCLDVYLWLTSGLLEVHNILGFNPKKVIVCGDSAGGGLTLSLALTLNDIRVKNFREILMPSALIAFYPVCDLRPSTSPSRLLTCFETFLPIGLLMGILDAYFVKKLADYNPPSNDDPEENQVISSCLTGPHSSRPPWYRKKGLKKRLEAINKSADNPYASPILYQNFDSLADVKLFQIIGEYDPLLDENIELAKKWKGPVHFDVLPNLSHGFLYFFASSPECKAARDHCFKRILESLEFTPKI